MKKLIFILFALVVLTACSKEKRIYKNLHKDGGVWNIKSWKSTTGAETIEFVGSPLGFVSATMNFTEDRNGSLKAIDSDGNTTISTFIHSNSATNMTLSKIEGEEGYNANYTIDWEKNSLTLTGMGFSSGNSETIVLEKSKN